jgi:hypothetical protein
LWGFSELLWAPVLFLLAVADLIEISETFIVALSLSLSTIPKGLRLERQIATKKSGSYGPWA